MSGCGGKPVPKTAEKPQNNEPVLHQVVHLESGNLTRYEYTKDKKREQIWTVKWKTADLDYTEGERPNGDMQQVDGTIYRDNVRASEFNADSGHAEKNGVLTLAGNVVVRSLAPPATLTCRQLEWDARKKIIVAKGDVRMEDSGYTLGSFAELWCSPDLKHVATPDVYAKS